MMKFSLLSILSVLTFGNVAWARPKTLTVTSNSKILAPAQLTFREQTTKSWLPGCSWYDILQNTGWFPATFYSEMNPVESSEQVFEYSFKKRSALALYCDARTDNVANSIALEVRDENNQAIAWGGFSYTVSADGQSSVEVHCKIENNPEEGQPYLVSCDQAAFSNDEHLELKLIVD